MLLKVCNVFYVISRYCMWKLLALHISEKAQKIITINS